MRRVFFRPSGEWFTGDVGEVEGFTFPYKDLGSNPSLSAVVSSRVEVVKVTFCDGFFYEVLPLLLNSFIIRQNLFQPLHSRGVDHGGFLKDSKRPGEGF